MTIQQPRNTHPRQEPVDDRQRPQPLRLKRERVGRGHRIRSSVWFRH